MRDVRVVIKKPQEKVEIKYIDNELESFQKEVGGYIEVVGVKNGLIMVIDEEGRLKGKEESGRIRVGSFSEGHIVVDTSNIVGNIVFTRIEGDDFVSLSDEDIEYIMDMEGANNGESICIWYA